MKLNPETIERLQRERKAAQELSKKAAAMTKAKKPRRKWITACFYGVIGADGRMHVGQLIFFSRFSLDISKNHERIFDYITEDLQWCKDTVLPWTELVHFGGVEQPIP